MAAGVISAAVTAIHAARTLSLNTPQTVSAAAKELIDAS